MDSGVPSTKAGGKSSCMIKIPVSLPPQLPSPHSSPISMRSNASAHSQLASVSNSAHQEAYYVNQDSFKRRLSKNEIYKFLEKIGFKTIGVNAPHTISLRKLSSKFISHANLELNQIIELLPRQTSGDKIRLLVHYFHAIRTLFLALLAAYRWSQHSSELNISMLFGSVFREAADKLAIVHASLKAYRFPSINVSKEHVDYLDKWNVSLASKFSLDEPNFLYIINSKIRNRLYDLSQKEKTEFKNYRLIRIDSGCAVLEFFETFEVRIVDLFKIIVTLKGLQEKWRLLSIKFSQDTYGNESLKDVLGSTLTDNHLIYNNLVIFLQSLLDANSSLRILEQSLLDLLIHYRKMSLLSASQNIPQNQSKKISLIPFGIDFGHSLDTLTIFIFTSPTNINSHKFSFTATELFKPTQEPSKAIQTFRNLSISSFKLIHSLITIRSEEILKQLLLQLENIQTSSYYSSGLLWRFHSASKDTKNYPCISGQYKESGSSESLISVILRICPYSGRCVMSSDDFSIFYYSNIRDDVDGYILLASDIIKACAFLISRNRYSIWTVYIKEHFPELFLNPLLDFGCSEFNKTISDKNTRRSMLPLSNLVSEQVQSVISFFLSTNCPYALQVSFDQFNVYVSLLLVHSAKPYFFKPAFVYEHNSEIFNSSSFTVTGLKSLHPIDLIEYLRIMAVKELVTNGYNDFFGDNLSFSTCLLQQNLDRFSFNTTFVLLFPSGNKEVNKKIPCKILTEVDLKSSPFITIYPEHTDTSWIFLFPQKSYSIDSIKQFSKVLFRYCSQLCLSLLSNDLSVVGFSQIESIDETVPSIQFPLWHDSEYSPEWIPSEFCTVPKVKLWMLPENHFQRLQWLPVSKLTSLLKFDLDKNVFDKESIFKMVYWYYCRRFSLISALKYLRLLISGFSPLAQILSTANIPLLEDSELNEKLQNRIFIITSTSKIKHAFTLGILPRVNASIFFQDAGLYRPQLKTAHPLLEQIRSFECDLFNINATGRSHTDPVTEPIAQVNSSSWNSSFGKLVRAIHARWPNICLAPDAGGGIGIELGLVLMASTKSASFSSQSTGDGKVLAPLLPAPLIVKIVGCAFGQLILVSLLWERLIIEIMDPLSKISYVNIYSSSDELIILLHSWKITLIPWPYGSPQLESPFLRNEIEHSQLPQSSLYSAEEFQIIKKVLSLALQPFSGPFLQLAMEKYITSEYIENLMIIFKLFLLPPVVLKDAIRLFSLADIQDIQEYCVNLLSTTVALTNACKMKLILYPVGSFQIIPLQGLIHFQIDFSLDDINKNVTLKFAYKWNEKTIFLQSQESPFEIKINQILSTLQGKPEAQRVPSLMYWSTVLLSKLLFMEMRKTSAKSVSIGQ